MRSNGVLCAGVGPGVGSVSDRRQVSPADWCGEETGTVFRRRGMTLIELLVCVVVVSVLAALLLPAVQSVRERGGACNASKTSGNWRWRSNSTTSSVGVFPMASMRDGAIPGRPICCRLSSSRRWRTPCPGPRPAGGADRIGKATLCSSWFARRSRCFDVRPRVVR